MVHSNPYPRAGVLIGGEHFSRILETSDKGLETIRGQLAIPVAI
jgi:hypothetical protein